MRRPSDPTADGPATLDDIEPSEGLPVELRRESIVHHVASRGFARVVELSERYEVSEVTIRSDLDALHRRGLVQRVRGGAMGATLFKEPTYEEALGINAAQKQAIGQAASRLVRPSETVFIDVGTTCVAVAHELARRTDLSDVLVATNGLRTALALEPGIPHLAVVVSGGTLRPLQHSLVDPLATSAIGQVRAHTAFIGCNGITTDGVFNLNLPEAEIKRRMIASARTVVVVADASKLGETSLALICEIAAVDRLITTKDADEAALRELHHLGVSIDLAD
jgi:DeoR family transcriptional regulator of aga operon